MTKDKELLRMAGEVLALYDFGCVLYEEMDKMNLDDFWMSACEDFGEQGLPIENMEAERDKRTESLREEEWADLQTHLPLIFGGK